MEVSDARKIVGETVSGRLRWGKMFLSAFSMEQVLDALVALEEAGALALTKATQEGSEELTKVKRQLTAAKAREAKQKKQLEDLRNEVHNLQETLNHH